jgi:hypothetical protein
MVVFVEVKPLGPDQLYENGPEPVGTTVKVADEPRQTEFVAGSTFAAGGGDMKTTA